MANGYPNRSASGDSLSVTEEGLILAVQTRGGNVGFVNDDHVDGGTADGFDRSAVLARAFDILSTRSLNAFAETYHLSDEARLNLLRSGAVLRERVLREQSPEAAKYGLGNINFDDLTYKQLPKGWSTAGDVQVGPFVAGVLGLAIKVPYSRAAFCDIVPEGDADIRRVSLTFSLGEEVHIQLIQGRLYVSGSHDPMQIQDALHTTEQLLHNSKFVEAYTRQYPYLDNPEAIARMTETARTFGDVLGGYLREHMGPGAKPIVVNPDHTLAMN
jgi:hypothetical protein